MHLRNSSPQTCSVTWETTDRCNFACWYCPENLHAGTTTWPDLDVSLRYFKFLREKHPAVFVDFIGGEPTLWPALPEFLENLPDGIDCEITTNGSRTVKWWQRVGPRLRRVTISHHFAFASDDHLLDVVRLLQPIVPISVLLLLDPAFCDRVQKMQEVLHGLEVNYETKPIFPDFGRTMLDYEDRARELLKNRFISKKEIFQDSKPKNIWIDDNKVRVQDLIIAGQNKFRGWSCLAGNRRLHIDTRGDVWAGSCRSKFVSHMSDPQLLSEPVICPENTCNCVDDIKVEKWIGNI